MNKYLFLLSNLLSSCKTEWLPNLSKVGRKKTSVHVTEPITPVIVQRYACVCWVKKGETLVYGNLCPLAVQQK